MVTEWLETKKTADLELFMQESKKNIFPKSLVSMPSFHIPDFKTYTSHLSCKIVCFSGCLEFYLSGYLFVLVSCF